MKCAFEHLPLATNHICSKHKRPIHAVCVRKSLDDAPLGRDIICFDCAEVLEEELGDEEDDSHDHEYEAESAIASIGGVSYQSTNLLLRQPGENCPYKKKGL